MRCRASVRRVMVRPSNAPPPPAPPDAQSELSRAAGAYRLASVRLESMRLFHELFDFALARAGAEALEFSASLGPARNLLPQGRGTFRAPGDSVPSVAFVSRPGGDELITPEGVYARANPFLTFGRLGLFLAALLALASSLLFALVWTPRALFGALRNAPDLRQRAMPALAALVLLELCVLLVVSRQPLGARNLTTLLLCTLTILFPALSLTALLESLRGPFYDERDPRQHRRGSRLARAHAFACSLLACWLSLEMILHGLAGIRTWAL